MNNYYLAYLLAFSMVVPVFASDIDKEERWRDEVSDFIMDGEAVDIVADNRGVFGIYTEAESDSKKGLIVVHGTGVHPNWEQVIQPIRVRMTGNGWHTLAIQMPILGNGATSSEYAAIYPEVPPRLKAAEEFLKEKGVTTLVIIAHSQGATMSSYYLAGSSSDAVGFIAIGMNATQSDNHINSAESLKKIGIPVLDLYGSEDLPAVLETVATRKHGGAGNPRYSQQVVNGANHFFDDKDDELIAVVSKWLREF